MEVPSERFVVRKNTPLYSIVQRWDVIDTLTDKLVERHRKKRSARRMCDWCNEHGKIPAIYSDRMSLAESNSKSDTKRFIVRKNTLPYVHQWAVIDTKTGFKVGEYTTEELAEKARETFCSQNTGLGPSKYKYTESDVKIAFEALEKRMEKPEGDVLPKPSRHSNKRIVELD